MIDGQKVGRELKAANKEIYGSTREMNSVFAGGNVGTSFLGLCIQESAKILAESVKSLAQAIATKQPPVVNNYYQTPDPAKKPKKSTYRGKSL